MRKQIDKRKVVTVDGYREINRKLTLTHTIHCVKIFEMKQRRSVKRHSDDVSTRTVERRKSKSACLLRTLRSRRKRTCATWLF